MALTIAVASLKGGVGKSTITLNLATCLHKAGHKVLIVDVDTQGTCLAWAAVAADLEQPGPPVVGLVGRGLRRDLERVADGFDVVVIDAPPRLGPETRAAMLAADLVLMPTTPGAADVWALRATLEVLAEALEVRPELRAVAVLNRTDRTTLAAQTHRAVTDLGVTVLPVSLGQRVAFGEATLAGQGVVDFAPNSLAAQEVEQFVTAVLAAVQGSPKDGEKDATRSTARVRDPSAPSANGARASHGRAVRGSAEAKSSKPARKPAGKPAKKASRKE